MSDRQQGVLWKRRDIFKHRWRPRWFVLQPDQGVLTYYLLTANVSEGVAAATPNSIRRRESRSNHIPTLPRTEPPPARNTTTTTTSTTPNNDVTVPTTRLALSVAPATDRNRTFSIDSQVSENTVDYDVVPRGTLDLRGGGCTVAVNDRLSKPAEHFFAFTIRAPQFSAPEIHLAARTPQSRRVWVDRIQRVIQFHEHGLGDGRGLPASVAATTTAAAAAPPEPPVSQRSTLTTMEGLPERDNEDEFMPEDGPTLWKPVGRDEVLYENVSPSLVEQIQSKIQTFLPVIDETPGSSGWNQLFERGDHSAYQKEIPIADNKSLTILKSIAFLDHPPRQILNLLLDSTRRGEFETNLKAQERLARLNPYTVLDYYSYQPVWPTSSREFAVVTHWHVLQKGHSSERALLLLAFSCKEADQLRPTVEAKHVRADLIISMVLIRPMGGNQCHYTRMLCFDPKVGFSQRLGSYITAQQAGQPMLISQYLQQQEPIPSSRMLGSLSEEAIIRDVVQHLPDAAMNPRRLDFARGASGLIDDDNSHLATTLKTDIPGPPALETQATFLLAPTLIYRILDSLEVSGALIIFLGLVFLAIRQVVLLHLGEILAESTETPVVGPVTCRFTVDLKGAMRFVTNKKEEREELRQGKAEVTIVHLVASALARALKEVPCLHRRRVILPLLWIDEVVDASTEPVSISISENSGGWITLTDVDRRGIQDLADAAEEAEGVHDATDKIGNCLVVAPPPADTGTLRYTSEIEVHAAPLLRAGVVVVAVLGNVRLEKGKRRTTSMSSSPHPPARSVIDVFLTMKSPSEGDFATCRRYAEEVQKLLQFPEMCDM